MYLRSVKQNLLSLRHILVLSLPGLEHRRLQRTSVAEREPPRLEKSALVDGVQVLRGVDLRLATAEEDDR